MTNKSCSLFLQANCNLICADEYGPETKLSMSQLNEKETPFELIEALLKYIETLNVPGAVLVFLPGWNLIYTMQKHLENNSHFGMIDSLIFLLLSWLVCFCLNENLCNGEQCFNLLLLLFLSFLYCRKSSVPDSTSAFSDSSGGTAQSIRSSTRRSNQGKKAFQ